VPENESLRFENENIEKWRSIPWRFIPKDEDDRSEYKI
jgi:hypothetical protein